MKILLFGFLLGVCISNFVWGIVFYLRNRNDVKETDNI